MLEPLKELVVMILKFLASSPLNSVSSAFCNLKSGMSSGAYAYFWVRVF